MNMSMELWRADVVSVALYTNNKRKERPVKRTAPMARFLLEKYPSSV
jgi:hypothetical protein